MAQVPYKAAPTVAPTPGPPPDYFHLDAGPEKFGAHIAKGLEMLGAGLTTAGDNWAEMQKDAAVNDALKESTAAAEEFRKLRGQEAVDAEPAYRARIDQIIQQHGAGLPAQWQKEYNNAIRPYQFRTLNGEMQTHSITEQNSVFATVNKSTQELAQDQAARYHNDPVTLEAAVERSADAAAKDVQVRGDANVPGVMEAAVRNAKAATLAAAANAKFVQNAPEGAAFVEANKNRLGAYYPELANKFRSRAETVDAEATADVTKQIYATNNPIVQRSILDANKSRLTEKAWKDLDAAIPGGATPAPAAAPGAAAAAPAAGSPKQPGESAEAFAKRRMDEVNAKPAEPAKPLLGGKGVQVSPEITLDRVRKATSANGRGELIDEAINTYQPGTVINVPGRTPWTVPAAGTEFEIEGIKHRVPGAPASAAAPAAPATQPATAQPATQPAAPAGTPGQNFTPIPAGALARGVGPQAAAPANALQAVNSAADPHQAAYTYFASSGWTPAQAAGIVGGLRGETENLNATQSHDNGRGIGIAGWNGDRRAELARFAAANGLDMNSRTAQLQFVNHELNTTEKAAGDQIRAATTPAQAAQAMLNYLRPSGYDRPGAHPERARYAGEFFDRYGQGGGTTATAMGFQGETREPHDHDIASYRAQLEGANRTPAEEQGEQKRAVASADRVIEAQKEGGHVRDLPIKETLRTQLDTAAQATATKAIVKSGGQPSHGRDRTGSHRHDNGGAADIELRDAQTGRLLDMNNAQDQQRMAQFVVAAVRAGATGVGAGQHYMGPHMLHIGGGTPAVWGGAPWIRSAWLAGQGQTQQAAQ